MTDAIKAMDLSQTDYLKLFMQELTYQDPLKPLDNREFMTQMAQFSSLQQSAETNELLQQIKQETYAQHSLGLLGKTVRIAGVEGYGSVRSIQFYEDKPLELRVHLEHGGVHKVTLSQITEVESNP